MNCCFMVITTCNYNTFNILNTYKRLFNYNHRTRFNTRTLKQTNLIVIDETSMMTSIILCAFEQQLKKLLTPSILFWFY
jgi:hypothetical protein